MSELQSELQTIVVREHEAYISRDGLKRNLFEEESTEVATDRTWTSERAAFNEAAVALLFAMVEAQIA